MSQSEERHRLVFPFLTKMYGSIEPLAYFLLRVLAGLFLAMHGAEKLFGWFGGNPDAETAGFAMLGFEPAHFFMLLTGWLQLVAGLLVMAGSFTRPAAAIATILLLVAAFLIRRNGFDWTHTGFEYALVWAAACLLVCTKGSGVWSIDHAVGIEV